MMLLYRREGHSKLKVARDWLHNNNLLFPEVDPYIIITE